MFSQNKVWFSHLKTVSNPDPIVMKFTSPVTDSKYDMGQDEDTGYDYRMCWFEARGDDPDASRYLVIDSQALEDAVNEVPRNQYVKLQATNSGEDAPLSWEPVKGGSGRSYAARSFDEGGYAPPTVLEAYGAALAAAGALVPDADLSDYEAESLRQKHAATMFIQWQKTGFDVPLAPVEDTEDDGQGDVDDEPTEPTVVEDDLPF